jgi:Fur family ferric uptake transcriptional regulator
MPRNLYLTRGRTQISELLQRERRYLSATAIHRSLASRGVDIALSTVYRTLDLLTARGIASSRTDEHGELTYVYCSADHHHHAICRKCGHVEDVGCGAMANVASALRRRHAFKLDAHAVEFYGLCGRCQ